MSRNWFCDSGWIDAGLEQKLDALGVMISQFAEGGANGGPELYPADAAGQQRRQQQVRQNFTRRFQATRGIATRVR